MVVATFILLDIYRGGKRHDLDARDVEQNVEQRWREHEVNLEKLLTANYQQLEGELVSKL